MTAAMLDRKKEEQNATPSKRAGAAVVSATAEAEGEASTWVRVVTALAIVVPLVAVVFAVALSWRRGFHWIDLGLLVAMYLVTILGVTVGFHRLFTHRSFETKRWVKVVLAVLGSMAVQGSLVQWVAMHRRHHRFSDTPDDPHTPHHRAGLLGLRGFWHAHIGWMFLPDPPDLERYARDIVEVPALRLVDRLFPLWVTLGLLLPGLVEWSWTGTTSGFLRGVLWGGLVRVFLVHHVTWSVNSACHLWGARPFESGDRSRNNALFGILGLGEGWHNAHHAFPTSARHGLRWWQVDGSYVLIRALERIGLVWNVKVPSHDQQEERTRPRDGD